MTNKEKLVEYLHKNGKHESWDQLSKMFGLTIDQARKAWSAASKDAEDEIKRISESINRDLRIVELEELVTKLARENCTPKDRLVRSMNPGPNPLDFSLELQKETILAEMRRHSPKNERLFTVRDLNSGVPECLLELSVFDLHIGKLSWDKETGEDYDINIAVERYRTAIKSLLSRVRPMDIDRILLPVGNDMINIDSKLGTTTAGTSQDGDSRFGKMFRTAKELLVDTISELSQIAPVDVIIVPGNHDELTMFTLGEVLDAWFHNDKSVTINNSPKLRKYYQYYECMLMFTHGNREKHTDLGMIAANEEKHMWANTSHREVHLGHYHKSKVMNYLAVDEYQGFKVRILPSLSGTDAWHFSKGYNSQKAAKAFVWHRTDGLISEHTFTIK
jgi:hypothetical protein